MKRDFEPDRRALKSPACKCPRYSYSTEIIGRGFAEGSAILVNKPTPNPVKASLRGVRVGRALGGSTGTRSGGIIRIDDLNGHRDRGLTCENTSAYSTTPHWLLPSPYWTHSAIVPEPWVTGVSGTVTKEPKIRSHSCRYPPECCRLFGRWRFPADKSSRWRRAVGILVIHGSALRSVHRHRHHIVGGGSVARLGRCRAAEETPVAQKDRDESREKMRVGFII